uniref:Oxysterol-binding protein n=1 Tax=Hemiscolopendra marginata TaxID=943146 RepID=A0A646QFV7_9MYRI
MSDIKLHQTEPEMKGWLYKWTNYIKGYQKRWFVLSNGLLSYYRTQAEMAHTCRGTISLHGAVIHTEDSCNFVISNGGTQTFHLKASTEVERQRWVTALELAKAKAIRMMESEDEDEFEDLPMQSDKNEMQTFMKTLSAKLEDLNTCNDLIMKHGAALQRSLSELEQLESPSIDLATKIKAVNERATLFRITSNAMMNACSDYLELTQTQGRKWQRMLQHEHEQRLRLEEMVEQLARQHSHLEQAAKEATSGHNMSGTNKTYSDGEEEFFDAEDQVADYIVTMPSMSHRRTASGISMGSEGAGGMNDGVSSSGSDGECEGRETGIFSKKNKPPSEGYSEKENSILMNTMYGPMSEKQSERTRRKAIPTKPNYSINLWSIMKNCIGKDLTKIPMPVNFSEPLSMLQRLTEDFEYSEILDRAAECDDNFEQMAYVAAFTVSPYATTSSRTGKPFNPLLGETYECDRRSDMGWYSISEQVSHHPPMAAQHCIGRGWACWQEFTMSSKFRGKYLQVIPLGISHLLFEKTGNHYTWRKITTTVHNIIVGKLWVDQHGEMDIINHRTGDKCHLKYYPYSYFSREIPRKVTGVVADPDGNIHWVLTGTWDNKLEAAKVIKTFQDEGKGKPRLETSNPKVLWKRRWPPPEYEKMYSFTELAIELNEPEDDVAPTDCRRRPDQRLMENAAWDEANKEKVRLEEKQRLVRRRREQEAERAAAEGRPYPGYEPIWFKKQKDPVTGNPIHMYQGRYWECKGKQDWSSCPDIF